MKKILLLLLISVPSIGYSQAIVKSKAETIQNIKNSGYTIKSMTGGEYAFSYTRFDEFGEAKVYFKCDNNTIRQALFICNPATGAPLRFKDIMRTMTRAEMQAIREKYGNWAQDDGSIITQSSKYYNGEARYSMKVFDNGQGELTITFLN